MKELIRLIRRFTYATSIGGQYGKALKLLRRGDVPRAFDLVSETLELARRLDVHNPETLGLLVMVTILFSQLASQLERESDGRDAALETLNTCADSSVPIGDPLGREIEKLKYYADLSTE